MEKQQYLDLLDQQPWVEADAWFGNLHKHRCQKVGNISINSTQIIEFTKNNFDLAEVCTEEVVQAHWDEGQKILCKINQRMGRSASNTTELNFGMQGDSNAQLLRIIGEHNFQTLGLHSKHVLARLIVNMPGNGLAYHYDNPKKFYKMFPNVDESANVVRYWFSAIDWLPGQVMQVGDTVLHHWNKGEVYNIPWGVPHASMNFGYHIKYTIGLTGVLVDEQ